MSEQKGILTTGEEPLPGRRALDEASCVALLREIGWGVLTVVEQEGRGRAVPIGVPVAYGHDGEALFLAMAPGRKRSALERHPYLCLTVTDVRAFDCWRSVMVIGRARWLADHRERARAVAAFVSQPRFDGRRLTRRDASRLVRSRLLVVEPDELRGFACGAAAWGDAR